MKRTCVFASVAAVLLACTAPLYAQPERDALQMVPDDALGFVIVPVEASPEQIAAGWRAFRGNRRGMLLGPGPAFKEAYVAMVAPEDVEG